MNSDYRCLETADTGFERVGELSWPSVRCSSLYSKVLRMIDLVVLYYLNKRNQNKRKRRKYGVLHVNQNRFIDGVHRNLYGKLREENGGQVF